MKWNKNNPQNEAYKYCRDKCFSKYYQTSRIASNHYQIVTNTKGYIVLQFLAGSTFVTSPVPNANFNVTTVNCSYIFLSKQIKLNQSCIARAMLSNFSANSKYNVKQHSKIAQWKNISKEIDKAMEWFQWLTWLFHLVVALFFLLFSYSFLYKNIVYERILVENLLKLKNKLRIKLGSTFCKATKFIEKRFLN